MTNTLRPVAIAALVLLLAIAGLASSPAIASSEPVGEVHDHDHDDDDDDDDERISEEAIDGAVDVRRRAGFAANRAVVESLLRDRAARDRGSIYGFPMTNGERLEMDYRSGTLTPIAFEVSQSLESTEAKSFAGVFLDHAAGGVIRIQTTQPLSSKGKEVLQNSGIPTERFVYVSVDYSSAELSLTQETLSRELRSHKSVDGVILLPLENRIVINMTAMDPLLERELQSRFGELVHVHVTEASADDSDIQGGHRFNRSASTSGACSAGPWGFITVGNANNAQVTTAGHCANSAAENERRHYTHTPLYIRRQWVANNGGAVDAARFERNDGGNLNADATHMIENWGSGADIPIVQVATANSPYDQIGAWVCQSGWRIGQVLNNNSCGTLSSVSTSCAGNSQQRVGGYVRRGGDSGATVYFPSIYGAILIGVHNGRISVPLGGTTQWVGCYSFIENVRATLGLTGWFTAFAP